MPTTPPRILLLESNTDGTVGGSHRALLDLVRHRTPGAWTPVVVVYQDDLFARHFRDAGAELVSLARLRIEESRRRARLSRPGRVLDFIRTVRTRRRLIKELEVDLVHLNNSAFEDGLEWIPAARAGGVPVVASERGDPARAGRGARHLVLRGLSAVVPVSRWVADALVQRGVPRRLVHTIHDGVDVEGIRESVQRPSAEIRQELGVHPDAVLLLMVGNLRRWKGQHQVLAALSRLGHLERPLHLILAGAGTPAESAYMAGLQEQAESLPPHHRVTFLGPRSDVPELMSACDLAIHASVEPEPFGLVVPEAMALGTFVAASSLGGPAEVITEGSGCLFDPGRPEELAGIIEGVALGTLAPPEAIRIMGRAEAFHVRNTVRKMESLWFGVLEGRRR